MQTLIKQQVLFTKANKELPVSLYIRFWSCDHLNIHDIVYHLLDSVYNKGLKNTAKSGFGGGNTKWEESRLGSFATSETRLVEVMENLCEGEDKNCHTILEENEELIEKYWFSVFAEGSQDDVFLWLCVTNMKVCCPDNLYGPTCRECLGGKERPCTGNGKCHGSGTRQGTGKCSCNDGYQGDMCDDCKDRYFEESRNDTHAICTACHKSCQSTCWEAGPKGCDECKAGYTQSEENGCQDINECVSDPPPCDTHKYCSNNEGSYYCTSCHSACKTCAAFGADKCGECQEGYRREGEQCTDIDECTEEGGSALCTGDHQSCVNSEGSYSCNCDTDFIEEEGQCIPIPPEPPKEKQSSKSPKKKAPSKKSKSSKKKQKPSLSTFSIAITLYGIVGKLSNGNVFVVGVLTVILASYIYWWASQYDRL